RNGGAPMIVWITHAKVGHRQAPLQKKTQPAWLGFFMLQCWPKLEICRKVTRVDPAARLLKRRRLPRRRQGERSMKRVGFPIYFNHVPKCAGTSLNELLSRSLHRDQLGVEPFYSVTELYTLRSERFDRLALVGSHVPHWVAARRLNGWTKLTILREPWSRFQALCRHLLRIQGSEPQALWPT